MAEPRIERRVLPHPEREQASGGGAAENAVSPERPCGHAGDQPPGRLQRRVSKDRAHDLFVSAPEGIVNLTLAGRADGLRFYPS